MADELVSVIVPTHNRKDKLIRLVRSILKSSYDNLEIIVVDDASTDRTFEAVKKMFPLVRIIRNDKRMLVSASRNAGIKKAKGEFIFFLDDDNIVDKDAISELAYFMKANHGYIASPLMLYYSFPSIVWCAGVKMNTVTYSPRHLHNMTDISNVSLPQIISCDYSPNAYMLSRSMLDEVGCFDSLRFPLYWEETDFFKRASIAGFAAKSITSSRIWHDIPRGDNFHIDGTRSYYRGRNRILFYRKYAKWRLLFSFADALYFSYFILSSKSQMSFIGQYLNGMMDGMVLKTEGGGIAVK